MEQRLLRVGLPGLLFICFAFSDIIFEEKSVSQADLKVYVTESKSQADLLVYLSEESESIAKNQKNIWYFTKSKSKADLRIFFVKNKSQADIIVKYVTRGTKK